MDPTRVDPDGGWCWVGAAEDGGGDGEYDGGHWWVGLENEECRKGGLELIVIRISG